MRIHNVRLGLATNSSSSHSLIFFKGATDEGVGDGNFGWDFFTAASPEAKSRYLAAVLYGRMCEISSRDVAETVARAWCTSAFDPEDSVDHQSNYDLPFDWSGKAVDRAFFDDLRAYYLREDVVILGGNDNTDERHPLSGNPSAKIPLSTDGSSIGLVARKEGSCWTLFNRESGAKIRLSFDGSPPPKRALVPELVDIKITDFCPFDCAFCYQDSTRRGAHAEKKHLEILAYCLTGMRVFEVAIGGGEPTMHPNFLSVLQSFRRGGTVPNFTTKSLAWLRDASLWVPVLEACGAFAYSPSRVEDIEGLGALLKVNGISRQRASVQLVMGTMDRYSFGIMLRAAVKQELRVTLLGYKTTGRGADVKIEPYDWWLEEIMKLHKEDKYCRIGIDTALAAQYEAKILDAGIPSWCFHTQEGKHSMYIDAVAQRMGPSSYVESLKMRPLDLGSYIIEKPMLEAFQKW